MKEFTLGQVVGGANAQDQMVAYTAGVSVSVAAQQRKELSTVERKVGWDHELALAALAGLGVDDCPYCNGIKQYQVASNLPTKDGVALEYDLPLVDRGGIFERRAGVKTNKDHLVMHINRAADALFAKRQARKAERLARQTVQAIRDAAALEKLEKGIVDDERPGHNERRKGGRFTSPFKTEEGGFWRKSPKVSKQQGKKNR